jgi:signal peptidase I
MTATDDGDATPSAPPPVPVAATDGPRRPKRRLPLGFEIILALVAVALVQAFLVKPFGVPSQSMENTLRIGDRIVVNRLDHTIARGDIVVFGHGDTWAEPTRTPGTTLGQRIVRGIGDVTGMGPSNTNYTVKRVIGLPGDRVSCCDVEGRVLVNGKPLTEPYVFENLPFTAGSMDCTSPARSTRCFGEIVVPGDSYLVMGDHRSQSADSVISCRGSTQTSGCARFVARERIVGPVIFRLWPLGTFGSVH